MSNNRALTNGGFIRQRGGKDCLIAATAELLGLVYEQIAEACGASLDPSGGPRLDVSR